MASYEPVVKNGASGAIFYLGLPSMATSGTMQANPTLAAGDVKIALDGGALNNLTTLPTVTPAAGKLVKVTLSQAETNADNVAIVFSDQTATKEWADTVINIRTVAANFDSLSARIPTALVGGRMDSSIGAVAAGAITSAAFAAGAFDAVWTVTTRTLTASLDPNAATIADAVWDEVLSGHLIAGSTGAALNSAGSAGDPWSTALPGAYGAGTAGKILGTNLDVTVSSRASATALAVVQVDTDDIQARLPAALVSGRMDSSVGAMATDVLTSGALAASAVTEIQTGLATSASVAGLATSASVAAVQSDTDDIQVRLTTLQADADDIQTRLPAALVGGKIDANVTGGATAASVAALQADTDDIQTRLPASLVGGRIDASVGSMAANTVNANALAADAVVEIQTGLATDASIAALPTAAAIAAIQADTDNLQTRVPAALVGGRMDASVGAMATDVVNANALAADAVTEINTGMATAASIAAVQADTDNLQTRLPVALVGGRIDASVGSMANDTLTAAALASDAVNEMADGFLDRNMAAGPDNGAPTFRTVRQALRFNRNKWTIASGVLTVLKEDDVTVSWTSAITTTAGNPVSASDPA